MAGEDEPARKEQRFAELSTGWGIGTAGLATETVWAQLDAREQGRRMTNATRVVPEVWAGDTGKAPEDIESHGGRTEGSGKVRRMETRARRGAEGAHDRDEPLAKHGVVFRQFVRSQHSIRIDDQWRLCFRWKGEDVYEVEIVDYH